MVFMPTSKIQETWQSFPPLCLKLRAASDVSWGFAADHSFFDVCRFLKTSDRFRMKSCMGIPEKELVVLIETQKKDSAWSRDQVVCILHWQWVANLKVMLDSMKECEDFSELQYVFSGVTIVHGFPTVWSVTDATGLLVDPPSE